MIFSNIFSHNNRFYNQTYFKNLKTYYDLNTKIFKWSIFTLCLLFAFIGFFKLDSFVNFGYSKIDFKNPSRELIWMVDVVIVLGFTLAHLIVRAVVINVSLVSMYSYLNKKNNSKLVKFAKLKSMVEQIYYCGYYLSMVIFGYYLFYTAFIQNTNWSFKSVWNQLMKIFIPHSIVNSPTKMEVLMSEEIYPRYNILTLDLFYLIQISSYLYQLIYILLNIETKRKDYYQMILHHVLTLVLTIGSYVCSFTNLGNVIFKINNKDNVMMGVENLKYVGHTVMIVTDTTDLFLSLSKILNYLTLLPFKKINYSEKKASLVKSFISCCCDIVFLFGFVASWVLGRHLLYNIVVYFCFSKLIPSMKENLSMYSSSDLGFTYSHYVLVSSLVWLLLFLQSLQIIWFFTILKLVFRVLNKKVKTLKNQETEKDIGDSRSDDEDDESEEDESDCTDEKEINDGNQITLEKIPVDEEFSLIDASKKGKRKKMVNSTIFNHENTSEATLAKNTSTTDVTSIMCSDYSEDEQI